MAKPARHGRDAGVLAFDDGLDAAVGGIPDPPLDADLLCLPERIVPEADTLHHPAGDDVESFHNGHA